MTRFDGFADWASFMHRALQFIAALVLALVWLPATLHCSLETAGAFEHGDACCQHEKSSGGAQHADCGQSACGLVESGDYQPSQNLPKVSAPSAVLFVFCLIELAPTLTPVPAIVAPVEAESPPEIRRTWHFVERAALSPRAPSSVC